MKGTYTPKLSNMLGVPQKARSEERAFVYELCRRSPNLPHTFACSTIGPTRLNFRVRDGNGWDPRGKVTGKLRRLRASEPAAEILSVLCEGPAVAFQVERRLAGSFSRGRGVRTVSSSDRQSADWRHSLADRETGANWNELGLPDQGKRKSIG